MHIYVWMVQNSELHVIPGSGVTVIAAQARESNDNTGYSFVHCVITGAGGNTFLGRAWMSRPRVVYIYTSMSGAITTAGWSDNFHPERDRYVIAIPFLLIFPYLNPKFLDHVLYYNIRHH